MRVAIGTDVLSSIALARAARAMWHRLLSEMGCPMPVPCAWRPRPPPSGCTPRAAVMRCCPTTVAAYAAVVAGVDGLEVRPHDFRSHNGAEPKARNTPGRCDGPETSNTCCGRSRFGRPCRRHEGQPCLGGVDPAGAEQAWTRFETLEAGRWRACGDLVRQWTLKGSVPTWPVRGTCRPT